MKSFLRDCRPATSPSAVSPSMDSGPKSRGTGRGQALFMGFGKESVVSSIHDLTTTIRGDSNIFSNLCNKLLHNFILTNHRGVYDH